MTLHAMPASCPPGCSSGAKEARVLIVLDVPDNPDDALRGDTPTEVVLGADIDQSPPASDELDDELEKLTDEVHSDSAPDEA